ncbi:TnsD family Tn7-like transposition protein [Reinekea sp. G2M2-21]|uniref:TnsD family Tn7-like transposition protein n=1 Tax=Reinekea sp. G2M2-21 TaxID=2788942 RepID=UPI0018AC4AFA|nr:TnsD family Tn7-like transposition protein [Reinekea sp. G2M2-21]
MLGFPVPYPEELVYSIVARSGVHEGETSPKRLLDHVFGNRKVIATIDLPSHLQSIANQYFLIPDFNVQRLISRHTLWPLYAPFSSAERNEALKRCMSTRSNGAAHLASGAAASRLKTKRHLYFCSKCLKLQYADYGEGFWKRIWQTPLVRCCPKHGPLIKTNITLEGEHRHRYYPVSEATVLSEERVENSDFLFSEQAEELFKFDVEGIGQEKWTEFYKQLANDTGFMTGSRINHSGIRQAVIQYWKTSWLTQGNFYPTVSDTSWTCSLFRKHRHCFSYAAHIIAIGALTDGKLGIQEAVQQAINLAAPQHGIEVIVQVTSASTSGALLNQDQIQWQQLVARFAPKAARQKYPALYARLYRRHYAWLMRINDGFRNKSPVVSKRVNWLDRDRQLARELKKLGEELRERLDTPRITPTLLLHRLGQYATVRKNLFRLPRCKVIISTYTESVAEYQSRRLTRVYIEMKKNCENVKRWQLLRRAGLSEHTITPLAERILDDIMSYDSSK